MVSITYAQEKFYFRKQEGESYKVWLKHGAYSFEAISGGRPPDGEMKPFSLEI